jgi:hypothetical protein
MIFLHSIWLFALIPWAGFTFWMLVGRRRRQWVPFLALWDAPEEIRKPKKGLEPPPLALVLALLAILLGVLAMSQPHLWTPGQLHDNGRITLIVDRGASMSAVASGKARYITLAEQVAPQLFDHFGQGSVDLVDVVSNEITHTDRYHWAGRVEQWKRTALDTTEPLKTTLQQRLQPGEPVIVLSDRDLDLSSDQFLQIKPGTAVQNAGILALASRPGQVMISLRATAALTRTLTLRAGDKSVQKEVALQPNVTQNVFVDLDTPGDVIEASIDPSDDFEGDNHAWLARQQSPPIIEARTALPEEVRRVIGVYARHRPTSESSAKLPIARLGDLRADEPGIVLVPVAGTQSPIGEITARPHALLKGVDDWHAVSAGASLASSPPGEGWTRLVWTGNQTLVAVKDGDTRQTWIGFDSRTFARTPAFVIFWTNVFDWTAGGNEAFTASPLSQSDQVMHRLAPEKLPADIDPAHWPGLFDTGSGKLAQNAGRVDFGHSSDTNWPAPLSRLHLPPATGLDLTPWLAIAALLCLLGAASAWEIRRKAVSEEGRGARKGQVSNSNGVV